MDPSLCNVNFDHSVPTTFANGIDVASFELVPASGTATTSNGCGHADVHSAPTSPFASRQRNVSWSCPYVGSSCQNYQDNTCSIGHPCKTATGAKVFKETDYVSSGSPLQLTRYYNSQGFWRPSSSATVSPGTLGDYWQTEYDRRLFPISGSSSVSTAARRPDGTVKFFNASGVEVAHFSGTASDTLVPIGGGGWTLTRGNDEVETYNASGYLTGVWDKTHFQQTIAYDASNRIQTVTDARGRQLLFSYTGNSTQGDIQTYSGGTVTVTLPDGNSVQYTVDTNDNLLTVTFPGNVTRQYSYANATYPNLVTDVIDENGTPYEHVDYDANGRVQDSYLAPGNASNTIDKFSYAYNANGSTTLTDPLGLVVTFTYSNSAGVLNLATASQPCSTCGAAGKLSNLSYDAGGYLQSTTDFNGNKTNYTFNDVRGLETQRVEAVGTTSQRTTNTMLDPTFHVPDQVSIVNVNNVTETIKKWTYNTRGQVKSRCEIDPAVSGASSYTCGSATNAPLGVRQWMYTYCDAIGTGCPVVGLILTIDGPRIDVSDTTTYAYYTTTDVSGCATVGGNCHYLGDVYTVTNALNQVTTFVAYTQYGRVARIKDADGTYTDSTYNNRGWLASKTVRANADGSANAALDATTTFTYDNVGNVKQVTQPDGTYLHYLYDTAHRLTDIYDSSTLSNYLLGNHIQYQLDGAGNRTLEQTYDPTSTLQRSLGRQFDQLNHLSKILNAASAAVQTYTNPAEVPPPGVTYTDGYDGAGNAIYSIDGTSLHVGTEQQYDPLNRLIQTLQDHAGTGSTHNTATEYAYDTRDNLRSVTDPDNLATSYTYDGLDNLTAVSSPDTGSSSYAYDAAGNRITQVDARNVRTAYSYDGLNRLLGTSYPTTSLNVTYSYDQPNATTGCTTSYPIGRLTRLTDNSGSTTYCYDRRGNVLQKKQVTNGVSLTTTYTYTLADRIATISYPSTAVVTYTRNSIGQITTVAYKPMPTGSSVTLVNFATYYPQGPLNVLTFGNKRTLTKTYDQDYAIDKVVSSVSTGLVVDATVDLLGNLTNASSAVGANPPTQQYQYDPLYRLTAIDNGSGTALLSFAYEATGDRTSKTPQGQSTQTYNYGGGTHHLTSVAGVTRAVDASGNTTSLNGATLTYDDRNRLTTVGAETYNYNGKGERVSKSSPATLFTYTEAGMLLGEYSSAGAVQREYISLDGTLVGAATGSQVYYVETDQLGTPRQVIQPAAKPQNDVQVWKWDYFANNSAFGENIPSPQSITFNLRFPGQYFDAETNLNYNYFRDYEPGTGRYVESDPMGLNGGISTFAYVGSNPMLNFDPKGLMTTVRCGEVMSGGYHCAVVAECPKTGEKVRFEIGGGGNGTWQRLFGGKIPPKSAMPASPEPSNGEREYHADCSTGDGSCGSCRQLECFKKMQEQNNPPPYYALWQNSNTYAHHLLTQCACKLDFNPSGAVAW